MLHDMAHLSICGPNIIHIGAQAYIWKRPCRCDSSKLLAECFRGMPWLLAQRAY